MVDIYMKKTLLKKYAELIVSYGLNVQREQDVVIKANIENSEFAILCAELCYKRGARKVTIDWLSQELDRVNYRYRTLDTIKDIPQSEIERAKENADSCASLLWLDSDDPDGLKGVDSEKLGAYVKAKGEKIKKYRDAIEGKYQWCIAAVPGKEWAKKLFPDKSPKAAMEALWKNILLCSRVTEDPIKSWQEHDADLKRRCEYLNSLKLSRLHYTSKQGTDLTVGLMDESMFLAGGESTIDRGIYYQPNIPSEECFTSPKKGAADGIVYATMPLSYQGALIENFYIRFKDGKAVEWHADKREDVLTYLLTIDEGASYIGECALVPDSSPIRQTGLLFYNTLFDENATCHIAFGAGFNNALRGYEFMTNDECKLKGVNDSMIHVDFMVGSKELNIDGITKDGMTISLIKDGEWAF